MVMNIEKTGTAIKADMNGIVLYFDPETLLQPPTQLIALKYQWGVVKSEIERIKRYLDFEVKKTKAETIKSLMSSGMSKTAASEEVVLDSAYQNKVQQLQIYEYWSDLVYQVLSALDGAINARGE